MLIFLISSMAEEHARDKVRKPAVKELVDALEKAFVSHEAASLVHVEPLARMLMDDPDRAVDLITSTYHKALDDAYTDGEGNLRGFVEATCGGPYEAIPADVNNAVGAVYPYLNRARKDRALGKVLGIMDYINCRYVQTNHTPFIREPLLLSDICIARAFYWPGLEGGEGTWLLKQVGNSGLDSFIRLKEELLDADGYFRKDSVRSDFIVAYTLLRSDMCCFGELYAASANQSFLERTLQAITGMRFALPGSEEDQVRRRERLKELLPESVQEKIDIHKEKADWVDPS